MRVHLVDGTYELFRAYYGAPGAQASDGAEVGATRSILSTLLALVTREGATHVAVAFDHVIESFRNGLFAGYKTGAGIEPELLAQFGLAEEAARALGLVVWPMVEFEADDALAAGAERYARDAAVEQVVLCTPDKDLSQCVRGTRVVGLDRRRDRVLDEDGVRAKFGVPPASIPDWLALVGDTADGIPGLPGWGPKSSATVLASYGHLDLVPPRAEHWTDAGGGRLGVRGAARLAETLCERREEALLYRRLATLRTDVPLDEEREDLRWRGPDRPVLEALCERLGAQRFAARVPDPS